MAGKAAQKTAESPRQAALKQVFAAFDLDGEGSVESHELMTLGEARQRGGQKARKWTAEKNAAMLRKLDTNGDGVIDMEEFVQYFDKSLPKAKLEFDETIEEFMHAAKLAREMHNSLAMDGDSDTTAVNCMDDKASEAGVFLEMKIEGCKSCDGLREQLATLEQETTTLRMDAKTEMLMLKASLQAKEEELSCAQEGQMKALEAAHIANDAKAQAETERDDEHAKLIKMGKDLEAAQRDAEEIAVFKTKVMVLEDEMVAREREKEEAMNTTKEMELELQNWIGQWESQKEEMAGLKMQVEQKEGEVKVWKEEVKALTEQMAAMGEDEEKAALTSAEAEKTLAEARAEAEIKLEQLSAVGDAMLKEKQEAEALMSAVETSLKAKLEQAQQAADEAEQQLAQARAEAEVKLQEELSKVDQSMEIQACKDELEILREEVLQLRISSDVLLSEKQEADQAREEATSMLGVLELAMEEKVIAMGKELLAAKEDAEAWAALAQEGDDEVEKVGALQERVTFLERELTTVKRESEAEVEEVEALEAFHRAELDAVKREVRAETEVLEASHKAQLEAAKKEAQQGKEAQTAALQGEIKAIKEEAQAEVAALLSHWKMMEAGMKEAASASEQAKQELAKAAVEAEAQVA